MLKQVFFENAPAARHESLRFKEEGNPSAMRLYESLAKLAEISLKTLGVDLSNHIYANCLYLMESVDKLRSEGKTRAANGIEHVVRNCQSEGNCPCRQSCVKFLPQLQEK